MQGFMLLNLMDKLYADKGDICKALASGLLEHVIAIIIVVLSYAI